MIFIIKGFWTIVFIFIVISTTFWLICPPAFFRCLSNSGTSTELQTTSFIESTGVACSDSISHDRVHVLRIPVLLLACSQDWTCNLQMIVSLEAYGTNAYNCYAMCPAGQTPEEGRRTYRPKRCENNKDEDNSPKTLNDNGLYSFLVPFSSVVFGETWDCVNVTTSIFWYFFFPPSETENLSHEPRFDKKDIKRNMITKLFTLSRSFKSVSTNEITCWNNYVECRGDYFEKEN